MTRTPAQSVVRAAPARSDRTSGVGRPASSLGVVRLQDGPDSTLARAVDRVGGEAWRAARGGTAQASIGRDEIPPSCPGRRPPWPARNSPGHAPRSRSPCGVPGRKSRGWSAYDEGSGGSRRTLSSALRPRCPRAGFERLGWLQADRSTEGCRSGVILRRKDSLDGQDRVELERERQVGQLNLPVVGQPDDPDPGRQSQPVRAESREVRRVDLEPGQARSTSPGGSDLQARTLGPQNPVRPFQARRSHTRPPFDEERHAVRTPPR